MEVLPIADLREGMAHIVASPRGMGTVELIVRRPRVDEREVVGSASITPGSGLEGDRWGARPHRSAHTEVTLMNARSIDLIAGGERERWPLAGDQLYVDFDLGLEHLPPGSRLRIGSVLLEVSDRPHTGCTKFSSRFGDHALAFVNSDDGLAMRLRGMNTSVLEGGIVSTGDPVVKEEPS
jgi:MOSC domain-containing protein YiiM